MGDAEGQKRAGKALADFANRGVYGWFRLVFLILTGTAGGFAVGSSTDAIMDVLYRLLRISPDEYIRISPLSRAGLVVTGIFLGTFAGALVLNTVAKVGTRWDRMPSGEKLNIFIGVFFGFLASFPFLILFNSLGVSALYLPFVVLGLTLGFSSIAIYENPS